MYKSLIKEMEYIPLKSERGDHLNRVLFYVFVGGVILVLLAVILAPKI